MLGALPIALGFSAHTNMHSNARASSLMGCYLENSSTSLHLLANTYYQFILIWHPTEMHFILIDQNVPFFCKFFFASNLYDVFMSELFKGRLELGIYILFNSICQKQPLA